MPRTRLAPNIEILEIPRLLFYTERTECVQVDHQKVLLLCGGLEARPTINFNYHRITTELLLNYDKPLLDSPMARSKNIEHPYGLMAFSIRDPQSTIFAAGIE